MKFALYIEPYQIFHSSFYTYQLLQQLFISKGHILDFYTPIDYNIDSIQEPNKKITINKLKDIYDIEFQIRFPDEDDYDVLLLEPHYYKKWSNIKIDMRSLIASKFQDKNKLVIVLNSSMLIETRLIKLNNIYYGIKSNRILALENVNKYKLSYFFMPSVSYLINPKPNHLSQQQFYQKYNLNTNKRIIAFLPGKLDKWRKKELKYRGDLFNNKLTNDNFFQNNKQIYWFKENCQKIIDIFHNLGYQIIGKMHIRDFEKFNKDDKSGKSLMKSHITYIQQYDTYELLKYSSYALTFGSTMVYQLYLYNIPSIEIGTGFYFPGWAYPTTPDNFYMKLIKKYNNGRDLIYGNVIDFDEIQENPHAHIIKLLSNITPFKYRINNPIYGKTYGHTIDDIYKSIIKISTLEKLKLNYLS